MQAIPSPDELFNNLTNCYQKVLDRIADKLNNPSWVIDMQYGGDKDPHYKVPVEGKVTERDKEIIALTMTDKGWHRVKITNSEEDGERPGMILVTFYRYEKPLDR